MIRRRAFLTVVASGILVTPLTAAGQTAPRVPRIGWLFSSVREPTFSPESNPDDRAFQQGLQKLGYVVGRNILIEVRGAQGRFERLPDLAAELVRLKVDVILVANTPAARAAQNATRTIPIVMVSVSDPVGKGFVASLAHPGGNITGVSWDAGYETNQKLVELLKEALPTVSRVAVLRNPANPGNLAYWRQMQLATQRVAVMLQPVDAQGPDEFESAFNRMTQQRAEALIVIPDPVLFGNRLVELATQRRLPAIYGFKELVHAGGFMSYGPDDNANRRSAATFVDKILKGAKPSDLPVEQPTKFELVINLKTAKALGLTIPPAVLVRADEIIQ